MGQLHFYNTVDLTESESRWLIIFTKRTFVALIIGAIPGVLMVKLIGGFFGIFICVLIELIAFLLTGVPLPAHWTLKGAGLTLDVFLLRKLVRAMNHVLYVYQHDDPDEVEEV